MKKPPCHGPRWCHAGIASMQIMAALPMLAAAASFVAPPSVSMRARMGPVRMASTSGLVTGEMVPAGALEALGVTAGKRAVIAFYCRDDGFECKKGAHGRLAPCAAPSHTIVPRDAQSFST